MKMANKMDRTAVEIPVLYDRFLLFAILMLMGLGLLMVASTSMAISHRQYGVPFYYFFRQIAFLSMGLVIAAVAFRVDIELWRRCSRMLLVGSFLLLVLVLIPGIGREVNGSMRWIRLGLISIQSSELAKFGMIVYAASYIDQHHTALRQNLSAVLPPLCVLSLCLGLLFLEPDFGASVVILSTLLVMLFLAGVQLRYFILLLATAAAALIVLAVTSPYRMERLTGFLNPWSDQFGSGYQLTQALIAFGQGGWLGLGLGDSVQKLFYLPEAHTDFLFAILAEELGLLGGFAVLGLFSVVVWRALMVAQQAYQHQRCFAAFLAYGFAVCLIFQVFINLGVNVGLLPTKGLTLPFMSYGGSSLWVNCLFLGVLLRIDHDNRVSRGR